MRACPGNEDEADEAELGIEEYADADEAPVLEDVRTLYCLTG